MYYYSLCKKGISLLSRNPFSYVTESVTESPLFNFWERTPNPLTACVKTVSFIHFLAFINRLAVCVKTAPVFKPEQTGNVATSYARKLFLAEEAHCERLSYILKQCAQTLANSLLLGIINLCSSFWEKNTVLTWARGFLFMFLAPFPFPARVCGESPAVNSAGSLIYYEIEPCHLLENNQKFTIRKERNAFVFNRKVCKQVRLISRESEQQQGSF